MAVRVAEELLAVLVVDILVQGAVPAAKVAKVLAVTAHMLQMAEVEGPAVMPEMAGEVPVQIVMPEQMALVEVAEVAPGEVNAQIIKLTGGGTVGGVAALGYLGKDQMALVEAAQV